MLNRLAFRLTLMYAFFCALSLLVVLGFSYWALQNTLHRRLDEAMATEIKEYRSFLKSHTLTAVKEALEQEAISEGTDRVFFRILDKSGKALFATNMSAWKDLEAQRSHLLAPADGSAFFETCILPNHAYPIRIACGRIAVDRVLQLGESTKSDAEVLQHFQKIFGIGIVAVLFCSMALGIMMSNRALSDMRRITQTAKSISGGHWDSRVPISRKYDEIDELAIAFNEMLEHIQTLIRELKEVTDDIAHDLRTPITRIRLAAEEALSSVEGVQDKGRLAEYLLEECDQILNLINTMLDISQTQAGSKPIVYECTDIAAITKDICDLFRAAAEDKQVAMHYLGETTLWLEGESQRLKRAIAHILDNAIKYTDKGGAVTVTCCQKNNLAEISISDTGIGIPTDDLNKVFTRFYRGDKSRSKSGNGLGLSLSQAILKAHNGDISVTSVLGKGSTFILTLPITKS